MTNHIRYDIKNKTPCSYGKTVDIQGVWMVGVAGFEPTASWSRIEITNINNNTFTRKSLDKPTFEGVFLCFDI